MLLEVRGQTAIDVSPHPLPLGKSSVAAVAAAASYGACQGSHLTSFCSLPAGVISPQEHWNHKHMLPPPEL